MWRRLNEAMVFPAVGLLIPFKRFRDTHLVHHYDPNLTDPYEDPETNYDDIVVWEQRPYTCRVLMAFNNTLLGRLCVGPILGQIRFMASDWSAIRRGDRDVLSGWLWHLPGAALVVVCVWNAPVSALAYGTAAYAALSILRIRTFLEHQAHALQRARSVIIEDRGVLAFLFLNNNFHAVHHAHPRLAWYRLPQAYVRNKDRFLRQNKGYMYANYREVLRRYLFMAKDPVPHPMWSSRNKTLDMDHQRQG